MAPASESSLPRSPPRRSAGRPSRLSRDRVIDAAIALLEEAELEDFTMAKLAKRLGASVMAIYTYFPGRDALLDASADHMFSQFEIPPQRDRWQDMVLDWLIALHAQFDRYPVALKVIAWEGHVSPGWLRAWLPVVRVLANQGMTEERLAFASNWFIHASMGFIYGLSRGPSRQGAILLEGSGVSRADAALLANLRLYSDAVDADRILGFGFHQIIAGLEALVDERTPMLSVTD